MIHHHLGYIVAILSKPLISISGENDFLLSIDCQMYCATYGDVFHFQNPIRKQENGNFCVFQNLACHKMLQCKRKEN